MAVKRIIEVVVGQDRTEGEGKKVGKSVIGGMGTKAGVSGMGTMAYRGRDVASRWRSSYTDRESLLAHIITALPTSSNLQRIVII